MSAAYRPLSGCALIALLCMGGAHAGEADARHTAATVFLGIEVGNTDTHRVDAGLRARVREAWIATAQIARAEFQLPEDTLTSTLALARVQYDFGAFGVGLGMRRGEVSGVSESQGVTASAFIDRPGWRLSAEIETRGTDLEATTFSEDLGTGAGVLSGVSRCTVDSLGYQAQLDVDRPAWAAFLSYRAYDYDAFDCAITLDGSGNGNALPPKARGRALGRLAAAPLAPVQGFGSRLVPREAMLLDSSISLGATLPLGELWIGGAELYRDEESIGGSTSRTALVYANRRFSRTWTLEFTLGFSDAQSVDDTAFAGIRASAEL